MSFAHPHEFVLVELKNCIEKIVPNYKCKIFKKGKYYSIEVSLVELSTALNQSLVFGREIPWFSLIDLEERKGFLRAFFFFRGSVTAKGVSIRTEKDPRRLIQLACILESLGIVPSITIGREGICFENLES